MIDFEVKPLNRDFELIRIKPQMLIKMKEVVPDVYYVGVNDHLTKLFEGLWPIPEGVSYNSYIVKGEKTALIETVKIPFIDEFLKKVEEVTSFDIDYIVLNHIEPDHSSSLPRLLEKVPNATIYCSKKAEGMLDSLYGITENIHVVEEGEKLDLGGRELVFYMDPLVHWPETMITYDAKDKILFSCDAFGSYKALDFGLFDDECDPDIYYEETIRYFSNIVAKYVKYVKKAMEKLAGLDIKIIAPAHGLIWRKNPQRIIDLYIHLSDRMAIPGVVVIWGSMYGNTAKVVNHVVEGIKEAGLPVKVLNFSNDHLSYLIKETWKYKGVILGFPTYDGGPFLNASYYLHLVKRKDLKERIVGFFGSYMWSGRALKQAADQVKELDWEIVEPLLEFKGSPTDEVLEQAKQLGKAVAERVKSS
ncbi:MAG: FprA family A-type flavoprotein [Candidatus Heimdallarchaeota archaeon]|nr:FprA family A-type flavoprotein [Candidatus Heimdallarchaeota archaeon]MCK4611218.1 FprA family A-type flavoprotein [Candidatus Heimdallarchaeota archaeon]